MIENKQEFELQQQNSKEIVTHQKSFPVEASKKNAHKLFQPKTNKKIHSTETGEW